MKKERRATKKNEKEGKSSNHLHLSLFRMKIIQGRSFEDEMKGSKREDVREGETSTRLKSRGEGTQQETT